jgi:hypothetical protein
VELDAAVASGFSPVELAGMPFDEGLGFRGDVEVFVEAGVLLADFGVGVLDQQPVPLAALAAGESKRMTTRRCGSRARRSMLHIDHSATKGSRCSGAISSQAAPHSPSDLQALKRS